MRERSTVCAVLIPRQEEYAATMQELFNIPVGVHFALEFGGSTGRSSRYLSATFVGMRAY
jgi:hypothetical protein